jgi:hypothetical protein
MSGAVSHRAAFTNLLDSERVAVHLCGNALRRFRAVHCRVQGHRAGGKSLPVSSVPLRGRGTPLRPDRQNEPTGLQKPVSGLRSQTLTLPARYAGAHGSSGLIKI